MRNGSRVADGLYIKRVLFGVGGFPFLLSLLILLYSKASYDFEIASTFVLFCLVLTSSQTNLEPCPPRFRNHIIVTNITYIRPCPLQGLRSLEPLCSASACSVQYLLQPVVISN